MGNLEFGTETVVLLCKLHTGKVVLHDGSSKGPRPCCTSDTSTGTVLARELPSTRDGGHWSLEPTRSKGKA
jgi:hypothetical protein